MNTNDTNNRIEQLCRIMARLRSEHGCPWDREQTPATLKSFILEEACELLEAIDEGDSEEIRDELGDLLLQIVFLARIFQEQGQFDLSDVITSISDKMIRRHPHVFADADAHDHARRWEDVKSQERRDKGRSNQLSRRIPSTLPALKRAQKLAKKLPPTSAFAMLSELQQNYQVLQQATEDGTAVDVETLMADILMLTTQLALSLHLDAEDLLRRKTTQMIRKIDEGI